MKQTTRLMIVAFIIIVVSLAFSTISKSANAEERYQLAPGRTVTNMKVPDNIRIDEHGCGMHQGMYKCYFGQFAGSVYTNKAGALAAWRFIVNPTMMQESTPEFVKGMQ